MTPFLDSDLADEVERLVLASRRLVRDLSAGDYASAFRGRGIEFQDVREYHPGDDVRAIDWRVTARMGITYLRRHQEERELTMVLLVDRSGSTAVGSRRRTRAQLSAQVAGVLALAAAQANDRLGAAFFDARLEHYVEPHKGRRHALRIIADLLAQGRNPSPAGAATDLAAALTQLELLLPRRAVLIILSDFRSPDFSHPLARIANTHDVVCIQLVDQLESALPPVGLVRLRDPETGLQRIVDAASPAVRAHIAEQAAAFDRTLHHDVNAAGADLLRLDAGEDIGEPLVAFFRRRARR